MTFKRNIPLISLILFSLGLFASDVPIIFVHGHKSEATPYKEVRDEETGEIIEIKGGWTTWYPMNPDGSLKYPTAMTKIADAHYGGYSYGLKADGSPAITCDKTTELMPGQGTKRIFNFSYYRIDGGPGVIGSNGELVCQYILSTNGRVGRKDEIPQSEWLYGYDYGPNNPLSGDKWAKNLADFIDKVLAATGASQVDIVAHSMGGVVARAAMKYYGCASKVRKLLTIGTPNHYFDFSVAELIWSWVTEDPAWMRVGEDWELSADRRQGDENITFKDINTGVEKPFTEFLDAEPTEGIATIAGNKGIFIPGHPNDGDVEVTQVYLSSAQFNPVIYASHSYDGVSELALTTCTYTTEFIKKWMIDDEEIVGGRLIAAAPILSHEGDIHWRGDNYYGRGASLRLYPNVNDFGNILTAHVELIREVEIGKDELVKSIGIPVYRCENPKNALVLATNPFKLPEDDYHAWIRLYDMNG